MGNRAAFGRPGALNRLEQWWYAKDKSSRTNAVLCVVIGSIALGLFVAALARDGSRPTGRASAARPPTTPRSIPPPFPFPTGLSAAGLPDSPADAAAQASSTTTTTTTSSVAVPATTVAPPQAASTPAPTVTTAAPAPSPATTVPTSDVVFSDGQDPLPPNTPTTTLTPAPPVTTTAPPTTSAPVTTTTAAPLLRSLPLPP